MSHKFNNPELTQINRQSYLTYLNSGNFITYDGPNADILIRELPCPEVYFDNQVHVLIDKKWQSLYDNMVNIKILEPDPIYMKSINVNDFLNLESFINYYNIFSIPGEYCRYFYYEDWRFIIYHYDLFRGEFINHGDVIQSSNKLIFNPEPCSLVYCGDFYETDFRMVNIYTAADILNFHQIDFKFNHEVQCFIIDQKTNCGTLLENIDIRIIKQDNLGDLLSRHIDLWRQQIQDTYDDDLIDPELFTGYQDQIQSNLLRND